MVHFGKLWLERFDKSKDLDKGQKLMFSKKN